MGDGSRHDAVGHSAHDPEELADLVGSANGFLKAGSAARAPSSLRAEEHRPARWCLLLGVAALSAAAGVLATLLALRSSSASSAASLWAESSLEAPAPGRKHVLVTGGAGYIGSHATLQLLELGHVVTVVDDLSRGNTGALDVLRALAPPNRLRILLANVGSSAMREAFRSVHVDVVIHFAAIAFVAESKLDPARYWLNITANTIELMSMMRQAGVFNLIYSSTCATYGNAEHMPVTELTPTRPISPYGRSKLATERAIRDFAKSEPSFRAVILRYFNVYGADPLGRLGEYPRPQLRHFNRLAGACFDAAQGYRNELVIFGTKFPTPDGTAMRDYVHVSDLVDANLKSMSALRNPPELLNVGTGKAVSVKEVVDACIRVTGAKIKVVEQEKQRAGDAARVWSETRKARRVLNWTARYVDIEEGLRTAWRWRQAHPQGYVASDPAAVARIGLRGRDA